MADLDPLVAALRLRRKARRETQTAVAERLGVNMSSVSAWERGAKQPCLANLHRWCAALGLEIGLWEETDAEA